MQKNNKEKSYEIKEDGLKKVNGGRTQVDILAKKNDDGRFEVLTHVFTNGNGKDQTFMDRQSFTTVNEAESAYKSECNKYFSNKKITGDGGQITCCNNLR